MVLHLQRTGLLHELVELKAHDVDGQQVQMDMELARGIEEVVEVVKELNIDPTVNGILVQLPLGPHVSSDGERTVTEAVSPEKDVDG